MRLQPLHNNWGLIVSPESDSDILSLDVVELVDLFKRSSVLLFRNFSISGERFELFTRKFGKTFIPHTNVLRQIMPGDGLTMSVTPGGQAIHLHSEMSYSPFRPDLIWFHCVTPASDGGETLLCDGINLFQKLDDGTRELFRTKRLKYIYRDILKWGQFLGIDQSVHDKVLPWAAGFPGAAYNLDQLGNVDYFEYVVSAISRTKFTNEEAFACSLLDWGYSFEEACFEDNSVISAELLRDLRDVSQSCAVKVELISNDLLMIDNSRVMHGRLQYQDSKRRVFVRMCNTDF